MKKILIVASSLDGYIAQKKEQNSTLWTSAEDKQWFNKLSRQIGTLLMGSTTYRTIGRPLPGRKTIIYTSKPEDFPQAKVLSKFFPETEEQLFVTGEMSLPDLMQTLQEKTLPEIAICGGAHLYQQALQEKLVDEIYLTLEPVFFGDGVKLLNQAMFTRCQVLEKIELSAQTSVWHLKLT